MKLTAVFEATCALSGLMLLKGVLLTAFGERKSEACLGCQCIPAVIFS